MEIFLRKTWYRNEQSVSSWGLIGHWHLTPGWEAGVLCQACSGIMDSANTSLVGSFGICPHMTEDNKDLIQGKDLLVAYYDVDYEKNAKGSNYWRNRWEWGGEWASRCSCLAAVPELG